MARSFKRRERLTAMSEINVTPLIDLAFALLIIFMITAPLLEQTIDLRLPQETARPQTQREETVVRLSLDPDGQPWWDRDRLSWDELDDRLAVLARAGDTPVLQIRADARLPYQKVVDLIDRIKRHKFTRISLETQSK
jgi:biopolymer transport protein ExbD